MRFALDEQILSQPGAVRTLLARIQVPALAPDRPLIFTGIGTSLHACLIAADWTRELSEGRIRPTVINAHELARKSPLGAGDQIVVVSHRGTKRFPLEVLTRARIAGATTVMITGEGAPVPVADTVIRTCPDERAGTHTVSYITALTALGCLVARLVGSYGTTLAAALESVPDAISQTLALPAPVTAAQRLAGREPVLVTGSDLDAITACEAALKIKEGTYQWAEGMETELALHGPPAALRPAMGAITITPSSDDGDRTVALRATLAELGVESLTCGTQDEDLRFIAVDSLVRPLVSIIPLQRLVAEIAGLRETNPDAIHGDIEPWKTAMARVAL